MSASIDININDTGGSAGDRSGADAAEAEFVERWKALLERMKRFTDEFAANPPPYSRPASKSKKPAGKKAGDPGYDPVFDDPIDTGLLKKLDKEDKEQEAAEKKAQAAVDRAAEAVADARKAYDRAGEAALSFAEAYAKYTDALDDSTEAAAKARQAASAGDSEAAVKFGGQANDAASEAGRYARIASAAEKREAAERTAAAFKEQEKRDREAQAQKDAAKRRSDSYAAAAGSVIATGIRGGGAGAAAGSAVGAIAGARFGPAGSAIGSALGEKAGGVIDNPLGGVASAGQMVAKGDGIGLLNDAANKAAIGLMAVPIAGPIAGGALKTFASAVTSGVEVMNAFAERGKELKGYSGTLAAANAQQDVTRILGDIRESQQLGDKYAAVIDKQTEFQAFMREALMPLREAFLDNIPGFMNFVMDGITEIIKIGYAIPGVKDDKVKELVDKLEKLREDMKRGKGGADILGVWLGGGIAIAAAPAPPLPAPPPLGVPLLPPP